MLDHNDALSILFTIDKLAVMCNIAASLDDEGIHVTTGELCNACHTYVVSDINQIHIYVIWFLVSQYVS